MPLSPATDRKLIHTREIRCQGFERADGLWDIEGRITDTKSYSFGNDDRTIGAGEPLHDMQVRLTIDEDMLIHAVEAVTNYSPFTMCPNVTPNFEKLVGLRIGLGWRKAVNERVGGALGCTHIVDLLLGPLAVTAFQSMSVVRRRKQAQNNDPARKPPLLNTCHAFASDSPVVKRRWPEHYTGQ
jgi:hypothetical protein